MMQYADCRKIFNSRWAESSKTRCSPSSLKIWVNLYTRSATMLSCAREVVQLPRFICWWDSNAVPFMWPLSWAYHSWQARWRLVKSCMPSSTHWQQHRSVGNMYESRNAKSADHWSSNSAASLLFRNGLQNIPGTDDNATSARHTVSMTALPQRDTLFLWQVKLTTYLSLFCAGTVLVTRQEIQKWLFFFFQKFKSFIDLSASLPLP